MQTCAFSDEIIFEKFQKVIKKLIEGVRIWTPITLTFFMINPNLRLHVFKIIITTQFQALVGGDGICNDAVFGRNNFILIFMQRSVYNVVFVSCGINFEKLDLS